MSLKHDEDRLKSIKEIEDKSSPTKDDAEYLIRVIHAIDGEYVSFLDTANTVMGCQSGLLKMMDAKYGELVEAAEKLRPLLEVIHADFQIKRLGLYDSLDTLPVRMSLITGNNPLEKITVRHLLAVKSALDALEKEK